MDLVFTELISNAVRHGGGLREARLANTGDHLRLVAADNDPRSPALRPRRADRPNGRGMHLIQIVADRWGVTAISPRSANASGRTCASTHDGVSRHHRVNASEDRLIDGT
jgi:two-component sensor histidine kinase